MTIREHKLLTGGKGGGGGGGMEGLKYYKIFTGHQFFILSI